ncbi:MAG TPA: Ig-like domain-containing protein [Ilumatobacter sp.]|nr:Ig-like domain-containing protein [Ilumatobacter sp.]
MSDSFAPFVGTDPAGVWRLWVYDDVPANGGWIDNWSIAFDLNTAPSAGDDLVTTDEDTPVEVLAPGLLANDNDPENDGLTVVGIVGEPAHGTAAVAADGQLEYTPDADFHGTDTFSYQVTDGELTDTATVTSPPSTTLPSPSTTRPRSPPGRR